MRERERERENLHVGLNSCKTIIDLDRSRTRDQTCCQVYLRGNNWILYSFILLESLVILVNLRGDSCEWTRATVLH